METSLIEQLDKSRYNLQKWLTIGWGLMVGTSILSSLSDTPLVHDTLKWIGIPGVLITIVCLYRFQKLRREVNLNSKIKKALNGELYQLNLLKSFRNGFFMLMGIVMVIHFLPNYITLPLPIVNELTLYMGAMTVAVSKLIYNRG